MILYMVIMLVPAQDGYNHDGFFSRMVSRNLSCNSEKEKLFIKVWENKMVPTAHKIYHTKYPASVFGLRQRIMDVTLMYVGLTAAERSAVIHVAHYWPWAWPFTHLLHRARSMVPDTSNREP